MTTSPFELSDGHSDVFNRGNALIVFCRAPRLGAVKTRLAATLGEEPTLQLYRAMLSDCFAWAESLAPDAMAPDALAPDAMAPDATTLAMAPDATTLACFTPADAWEQSDGLAALWDGARMPQRGDDLGARMLNALADARAQNYERALIIGSDAPDLPADYGRRAFDLLSENDVVIGPSSDGGFVLIGAARPLSDAVFDGIIWSRDDVCARLLDNLRALQLSFALLEPWRDVDEIADLEALRARLRDGDATASATRAALEI